MYDALDAARYIIAYEETQSRPVSNLRLQMLLYFVQAKLILAIGRPCFSTRMEAWAFGPVVPQVYQEYRIYGGATIPVSHNTASINAIDVADRDPVNSMLDQCANYSTSKLISISHKQLPWINAYASSFSKEITAEAMRSYFAG